MLYSIQCAVPDSMVVSAGVGTVKCQDPGGTLSNPTEWVAVAGIQSSGVPSGLPADFDYTALAAVWVFAMSVVVASYVIAKGMGTLIAMFKS